MVNRLRLPAVLATVVLTAAGACGSDKPPPDARQPDAFVDPCDDISFGVHCVDDGTGTGTCPMCADSFGNCPPGCTPV